MTNSISAARQVVDIDEKNGALVDEKALPWEIAKRIIWDGPKLDNGEMSIESREASDRSVEIWILDDATTTDFSAAFGAKYRLRWFGTFGELKNALDEGQPKLVIAESKINSELLPALVQDLSQLPPVLVVSSCNDPDLIHSCLDFGAEDYLVKPVDGRLLTVKVERLLRAHANKLVSTPRGLTYSAFSQEVSNAAGDLERLTVKEFQIFSILYRRFPEGVNRALLQKEIWGNVKVVPKALDVHLFKLRRKLESLGVEIRFGPDGTYYLISKEAN